MMVMAVLLLCKCDLAFAFALHTKGIYTKHRFLL